MTVVPFSDIFPGADVQPLTHFTKGNNGRKAVVIHINQGNYQSSIDYLEQVGLSAHFEISKRGKVGHLVDTENSAWANGLSWSDKARRWVCPHDHVVTPTWQLLDPADTNPNFVTISLENEGWSGVAWPTAQFNANVKVLVWLAQKYPTLAPYEVGRTLIGHGHLDPRDKAFCPGDGVDLFALAETANAALGFPAAWLRRWESRGVALPAHQIGWGIPQTYKPLSDKLGGCLALETPVAEGVASVALFEHGAIWWVVGQGATVTLFRVSNG